MLRPGRPLNTRLTAVSSGAVRASASAQAGAIPASGQIVFRAASQTLR